MNGIGREKVAQARGDERFAFAIADITGLTAEVVADRMRAAHGTKRVSNVFADTWPWRASALAERTAAFARDYDLREELCWVTGATRTLVTRRLNSAAGKKLLKNVFWDYWPEKDREESGPSIEDEAPRIEEGNPEPEPAASVSDASDVSDTLRPGPPREIGVATVLSSRYTLQRLLGVGGFGTSWEAHDRISDLTLVVKLPIHDDAMAIQRELRTAFRLVHPAICQAFPERDDDTGNPFLVLQHGGESLSDRLMRMGSEAFPLALAIDVLVAISGALDYLHENLIVHLDVSPANILIDDEDIVRLTDFGASAFGRQEARSDGGHTVVATSVTQLNPIYAAPELRHGEGRARSDQYSLALTVCSLLEGRAFQTRYRFQGLPQLSTAQNEAVRRALSQHPEERFDSCGDFARAVADASDQMPIAALALDLDRLSRDLVHRFRRELEHSGDHTTRLGGTVKLGRAVERFLHATLLWMASTDGFDAEAVLRELDPRTPGLARATAGRLGQTLLRCGGRPSAAAPQVRTLLADLGAHDDSRFWRFINVRNEIVHGAKSPQAIEQPASDVARLLREHRSVAGWPAAA